jgi:hypothetical protein
MGARVAQRTYLVLCLGLGELNGLLEDIALLLQLDCLLPVIKGAGHVHVVGIVFPADCERGARLRQHATYHVNVYLPMAA